MVMLGDERGKFLDVSSNSCSSKGRIGRNRVNDSRDTFVRAALFGDIVNLG